MVNDFALPILWAEEGAAFDDATRDGTLTALSGQGKLDPPNVFRAARLVPAVEYIRAMRLRTLEMHKMQVLMSDCDVIVTPSTSAFQGTTNFTGHPVVTIPAGFVNGEPEAIHLTGRPFEEGTIARVAQAFQDTTSWHNRRPPSF